MSGATRREAVAMMAAGAALLPAVAGAATGCAIAPALDGVAATLLDLLPDTACGVGTPGALDGGPLARRMDDYSPANLARYRAALAQSAAKLAAAGCAGLDGRQQFQLDAARAILANAVRTDVIPYGRTNPFDFGGHIPYIVAPVAGPHIDVPNLMMTQQSIATPAALDAWLTKLEGFGAGFDALTEKLRADEAAGCRPPQILSAKVLPQLDSLVAGDAVKQPLLVALADRMAAAGLGTPVRDKAMARAVAAMDGKARPAFARLRAQVAGRAARGRAEAGIWAQPQGEALYAANVRNCGDTALTPAAIHQTGLDEVRRITAQMDALLKANGYAKGAVGARMTALRGEARFRFPDSDAGRTAVLDYARDLVKGATARYPQILPADMIPTGQTEVRRVPPASQDGAPGAYASSPSLDGSVPGIAWINLRDIGAVTRVSMPTLLYHEAVPGHLTAGTISNGIDQPLLLKLASFNAYNEGWALYCERLMAELGAYASDPFGDLGRLQDELFRAVRLVVDTGMHQLRWSREQAIAYMSETAGNTMSEVIAEIERYMAWPGQALGYKLGQLRLIELREKMRADMGARFDLRRFHRAVLGRGNLPLDLVAREVARLEHVAAV